MMHGHNPWDQFAKDDPTFYISTKSRWREEDHFWRSGERTVAYIWERVYPRLPRYHLAVEIGVGIGRLAVPMAKKFRRLKVVDTSEVMLRKFKDVCAQFGVSNIESFWSTGPWDAEPADFIYSALTFQHIEDIAAVEEYILRIAGCLNGIAFLQFDTRPRTLAVRIRDRLPDWMMPKKTWRRGIRRIRRRSVDLRAMFARHHLRIIQELDPDSILHAFVVEPERHA